MTGIICGQLNPKNKDAIDWHPKGLVGYGCHTVLTIVDVASYKTIQTLCGHEKPINLVKFGLQESYDENAYGLKCVSSDISGKLIVWAVIQGKKEISFQKPGDEVVQMQWYTNYEFYTDLLLTLHASNTLVLWNTRNGEKFWILNFSSKIFDFGIDPRNYTNIAFAATNSIVMFLKNVTIQDTPILNDTNLQTIKFNDDGSSSDENQIVQIAFHKAYEDLLFAIFPSKVALLHTESKQIIATVNTENMFPLCRILPCSERDAFYLVHSNGVISFWKAFIQTHKDRFIAELTYDQITYNDAQRFFSKNRIFGAHLCPTTESTLGLLFNSGKLIFYQLNHNDQITILPYRIQSLADITPFDTVKYNTKCEKLSFVQSGMVPSLGCNATTVRIRPMDNIQMSSSQFGGKHLAAIGSTLGSIQFIDVFTGKLEKELNIHNCAVKCLEWAGCDYIVSAAYSSSITANGSVRNDIFVTNVLTGAKSRLRPEADESPIQLLRVSFYQRYLAIAFRNDPLEIWDLFSNRLLRRMSRKCPIIVDMAWSGKHHNKKQTENDSHIFRENLVVLDNENHLYHVIVKGLHVRDGKEVNTQWKAGSPPIKCMSWKDDLLAFGDVNGYLRIWDLSKRTLHQVNSSSLTGPIMRCAFSRLFGDSTIVVQYAKGVVMFDALCLKQSSYLLTTESTLLDVDMFGVTPVCISAEGIFRFAANTTKNNCLSESEVPLFLSQKLTEQAYTIADKPSESYIDVEDDESLRYFKQRMETEDEFITRNIAAAKFGGNMPAFKLLQVTDCFKSKRQLPPSLSLFWQSKAYRKRAKGLTKILLGTCKSPEQLDKAVERAVVLKKFEWAKYALLNADITVSADTFRLNSFKGCLLNSHFDEEEPRCFIKMVATNLIAQNQISDGIILLFLIEQGIDACRFLASNGRYLESVQYSKMSKSTNKSSNLSPIDSDHFFSKWAELISEENSIMKMFAALIFASLGNWEKARNLMLDGDDFVSRFSSLVST